MWFALILSVAITAFAADFTTSINGPNQDVISAVATDAAGNSYAVGNRKLPFAPNGAIFVTKLDPTGQVIFTKTFAGTGIDTGAAIAVDHSSNIYIGGATTSSDFPLVKPIQTKVYPGEGSGFVMKLSSEGTVVYSTLLGGTLGSSAISPLATDTKDNLYLTGYTQATDFPHSTGMPFGNIGQNPATPGAILASISASGDRIRYSGVIAMAPPCATSCIGNGLSWEGVGIAVDADGNAYVAGNDASIISLPTTQGAFAPRGIGPFVAKVNAEGAGLGYLTYIASGRVGAEPFVAVLNTVYGISVDAKGNAYITGRTSDPNFPTTAGSYQSVISSVAAGFVAKLNPAGSALIWATYLNDASPQSIAVDASGDSWITGTANLDTFPNVNGWTTGPDFLARVDATGSRLTYSARYPAGTIAQSIAVEPNGPLHVAGTAGFVSSVTPNAQSSRKVFAVQNAALGDITARVSPAELIAIYGPAIGPQSAASATPVNGSYPTTLGGVQVTINNVAVPLLYVSANQINAIVPMLLKSEKAATLRVVNGAATAEYAIWVTASQPKTFPTVLNEDGTMNSQTNPAAAASTVSFYATGWDSDFSPLRDGEVAANAHDVCVDTCTVSAIGGGILTRGGIVGQMDVPAVVTYGGAAPGLVAGVTQFNVRFGASPFAETTGIGLTLRGSAGRVLSQQLFIRP